MPHTHSISGPVILNFPKSTEVSQTDNSISIRRIEYGNETFYFFNSQNFEEKKHYEILILEFYIPAVFKLNNTQGSLKFIHLIKQITNITTKSKYKLNFDRSDATCSENTIAWNNKIEFFLYNNYYFIPFIGYRDDESTTKPELRNKYYLFFYKLNSLDFALLLRQAISYNTQWAFHDDIGTELVNDNFLLTHQNGRAENKIRKNGTRSPK